MGKGFRGAATSVLKAIRRDLGEEYAYAIDDIRHKVVEEAWFGHRTTPETSDFYRWLGPTPGQGATDQENDKAQDKGDALGRTAKVPEVEDIMPMEGRPSNHAERQNIADAYARHQEAGPMGAMEMEDIHNRDWAGFEEWLDHRADVQGHKKGPERNPWQELPEMEHDIIVVNDIEYEADAGVEREMADAGEAFGIGE